MPSVFTLTGGSPWGFRLVGGQDFRTALAVSKVTPGGKAEKSGIASGMVLLEINSRCTKGLTHLEAQNQVKSATSSLKLVVESADNATVSSVTNNIGNISILSSNNPKPASTKTCTDTGTAYMKPTQTSSYQPSKLQPPADFLPPPPAAAYIPAVKEDPLPPPPDSMLVPEYKHNEKSGDGDPICEGCRKIIRGPYLAHKGKNWHIDEFLCAAGNCQKPLQNIGFIEENGQRYCKDCYEKHFAQTCGKCCKKVIGEVMHALNQTWHMTCFVCSHCDNPFKGGSFQMKDDKPYCIADYNKLFGDVCKGCKFQIEAGDHYLEAIGEMWHDSCFTCAVCHCDLRSVGFFSAGGRPVCSNHRNARVA